MSCKESFPIRRIPKNICSDPSMHFVLTHTITYRVYFLKSNYVSVITSLASLLSLFE